MVSIIVANNGWISLNLKNATILFAKCKHFSIFMINVSIISSIRSEVRSNSTMKDYVNEDTNKSIVVNY